MNGGLNRPAHDLRVVIVGAGFGGLNAARAVAAENVSVTLIDRRNFHLFQPLLYQVASGFLSPDDITAICRSLFAHARNIKTLQAEVTDVAPKERMVLLEDGSKLGYDLLVIAGGAEYSYFGHDEWRTLAPGLKTVEDALLLRNRIFGAFELAERTHNPELQKRLLTFAIIGGGPTGVELAGTLAELARHTLQFDYRSFNSDLVQIVLFEAAPRLLSSFHPQNSHYAETALKKLGVKIYTNTIVTKINPETIDFTYSDGRSESLPVGTFIWGAGVKGVKLGHLLKQKTGVELDTQGRVKVLSDLSIANSPDIFVLGDLAHFAVDDTILPGVAQVAIQQGRFMGKIVKARISGNSSRLVFHYRNRGNLAVIGRNRAVFERGRLRCQGFVAWVVWAFVHIWSLIGFENKMVVLFHWGWNYLTLKRGSRLVLEIKGLNMR